MMDPDEKRFWSYVGISGPDECWEWLGSRTSRGYGQIQINYRKIYAHRYMYMLGNYNLEAHLSVCHTCDNCGCVNPNHLWLGTQKDNMQDCIAKGRSKSKLTEQEVIKIRSIQGMTITDIAKRYDVGHTIVSDIRNRRTWKHLP